MPQTLAIPLTFLYQWCTLFARTMSSTNEIKGQTSTNERKTESGTAPSQNNQQPVFSILPHPAVSPTYLHTHSVLRWSHTYCVTSGHRRRTILAISGRLSQEVA